MNVQRPALIEAQALGEHDYPVSFRQDDGTVVIRVHADPAVAIRIVDDEKRVVEATAAYLIARQSADELPEQLGLDDVAATYDNYVDDLHAQLIDRPPPRCGRVRQPDRVTLHYAPKSSSPTNRETEHRIA